MSLACRGNGCYECSRRRVRCDKTEPECFKCKKKGLHCSGQGIRYRFSSGVTSKGNFKTAASLLNSHSSISEPPVIRTTSLSSGHSTPQVQRDFRWVNVGEKRLRGRKKNSSHHPSNSQHEGCTSSWLPGPDNTLPADFHHGKEVIEPIDQWEQKLQCYGTPSIPLAIESLSPQMRLLFNHSPIMVVLDCISNGYRDIILPLACQDEVVGRAVSVVAAFHLASKMPELQCAAEAGQQAIISKLRRDSIERQPNQPFSLSTLATILVLLVGETVTGRDNYVYLLEILMYLIQSSDLVHVVPVSVRDFFVQQSKMFALFGFPLSQEGKGIQTMQNSPDDYLEFMSYRLDSNSEHYTNINLMKAAIHDACEIYRRRAESCLLDDDSVDLVESLRQKVVDIDHETKGSHALVWTYFVAAAESTLIEHRKFFSDRLIALYGYTQFRSIPAALMALDTIWARQGSQRWTAVMTNETPILIM